MYMYDLFEIEAPLKSSFMVENGKHYRVIAWWLCICEIVFRRYSKREQHEIDQYLNYFFRLSGKQGRSKMRCQSDVIVKPLALPSSGRPCSSTVHAVTLEGAHNEITIDCSSVVSEEEQKTLYSNTLYFRYFRNNILKCVVEGYTRGIALTTFLAPSYYVLLVRYSLW